MGFGTIKLRSGPWKTPEVDLLGAAFGLPTRRDVERAERHVASHRVVVNYGGDKFQFGDASESESGWDSDEDSEAEQDSEGEPTEELDHVPPLPPRSGARRSQARRSSASRPSLPRKSSPRPSSRWKRPSTPKPRRQPSPPPEPRGQMRQEVPPSRRRELKPVPAQRSMSEAPKASKTPKTTSPDRPQAHDAKRPPGPPRNTSIGTEHLIASHLPPSATFPIANYLASKPDPVSPVTSVFSEPGYSRSHTERGPSVQAPVQLQPQLFYQPQTQLAYAPGQILLQQPQYLAAQFAPATTDFPQPAPAPLPEPFLQKQPLENAYHIPFAQAAPSQRPMPLANELQRIQQAIVLKQAQFSQNPGDGALEVDLRDLQTQLNSTMNAAMTGRKENANTFPSAPSVPPRPQSSNKPEAEDKQLKLPKESYHDNTKRDKGETPSPPKDKDEKDLFKDTEKSSKPRNRMYKKREQETRLGVRHHLCSGCQDVRSVDYHDKHPFVLGQNPILNYCGSCFPIKLESNSMVYHCCFGCGRVRSKKYQARHAAPTRDSPIPNYCGQCRSDLGAIDDIPDASMLGMHSGSSERVDLNLRPIVESDMSSVSTSHRKKHKSSAEEVQSQHLRVKLRKKSEPTLQQRRSYRRQRDNKSIDPLRLEGTSRSASSQGTMQTSPYCPDRSLGSAHRRSQRGSPLDLDKSFGSPDNHDALCQSYHSPYVEEVSPVAREGRVPLSARSRSDGGHRTPRTDSRMDFQTDDLGLGLPRGALRSSRQPSEFPGRQNRERHEEARSSADEYYEDEVRCQSRVTSSGSFDSKSSKSVRFTPLVEVHQSRASDGSQMDVHQGDIDFQGYARKGDLYETRSISPLSPPSISPTENARRYATASTGPNVHRPSWHAGHDNVLEQDYIQEYAKSPKQSYKGAFNKVAQAEMNGYPRGRWTSEFDNRQTEPSGFRRLSPGFGHPGSAGHPPAFHNSFHRRDDSFEQQPPPIRSYKSPFASWSGGFGASGATRGGGWGQSRSVPSSPRDHDDPETAGNQ